MIDSQRVALLNDLPEQPGDYVLYWMQNSQRAEFNPALEAAIDEANRRRLPVLVGFGLSEDYPEANARHYAFMLEGLAEAEQGLRARGLGFVVRRGSPANVAIELAQRAALVVCDRGYLRPQKQWYSEVAAKARRRVLQVEGDVVVPIEQVSTKPEIGARTLRPKLLREYEELVAADTHDPYWNAAMCEMLVTGYMQNYMRMYWGKKVLEWSTSPEEGYTTLLRLNNTFFIDGRDASSYANVGWTFGLHDRPWPERPIFGKVRSMTAAGLKRKTDIAIPEERCCQRSGSAQPEIVDAEQFGGVGPSVDRAKSGTGGQVAKLADRIFVGIFSMDQLTGSEINAPPGNCHLLVGKAADVDFYSTVCLAIKRIMFE